MQRKEGYKEKPKFAVGWRVNVIDRRDGRTGIIIGGPKYRGFNDIVCGRRAMSFRCYWFVRFSGYRKAELIAQRFIEPTASMLFIEKIKKEGGYDG